jgi:hypothetical protein
MIPAACEPSIKMSRCSQSARGPPLCSNTKFSRDPLNPVSPAKVPKILQARIHTRNRDIAESSNPTITQARILQVCDIVATIPGQRVSTYEYARGIRRKVCAAS